MTLKTHWLNINDTQRHRNQTLAPESFSSFSMESITTISSPSSLIHTGRGVPQNLLRLTAQSLAFSSQLWNRFYWNNGNTNTNLLLPRRYALNSHFYINCGPKYSLFWMQHSKWPCIETICRKIPFRKFNKSKSSNK